MWGYGGTERPPIWRSAVAAQCAPTRLSETGLGGVLREAARAARGSAGGFAWQFRLASSVPLWFRAGAAAEVRQADGEKYFVEFVFVLSCVQRPQWRSKARNTMCIAVFVVLVACACCPGPGSERAAGVFVQVHRLVCLGIVRALISSR